MSFADHTGGPMPALKQDQRYVGLRAAEALGYFSLSYRPAKSSDLGNIFGRQELLVVGDRPNINRVLAIKVAGSPFEVGDDIVRFDAVDMVDHRKVVDIGDEGKSDQSMNVDRFAFPISEKIDVAVSKFAGAGTQNLPVHPPRLQSVANTVQASNAAEVADLVKITEASDRNRSPFFYEGDIHSTGCPSGEVGLAIKDPSHASTFGGSATMTSASDNYNGRLRFR